MPGELIPRKREEVETWKQPELLPARQQDFPAPPPVAPAPQVQNVYIVPEGGETRLDAIVADLSRPWVMLIWGAVLIGIYVSGWWMLTAGFAQIGMLLFATLFVTSPNARKYLLVTSALLFCGALIVALTRNPGQPNVAETGGTEQAPVKASPTTKARKNRP